MSKSCKPKCHWNKENCAAEAKKYDTRSDLKRGSNGAYQIARDVEAARAEMVEAAVAQVLIQIEKLIIFGFAFLSPALYLSNILVNSSSALEAVPGKDDFENAFITA